MTNETKEYLIKLASTVSNDDDPEFNYCDYSGGNLDDAGGIGYEDGQISLAREILTMEHIHFVIKPK